MAIKRQQIMDAIVTRMQTIAPGTYYLPLGADVGLWRKRPIQDHETDVIVIRDPSQKIEQYVDGGPNSVDWNLTVEIEVFQAKGSGNDTYIRKAIADVYKAIGQDQTWGGIAHVTMPISDVIQTEQEERIITGALITVEVIYRTGKWSEN